MNPPHSEFIALRGLRCHVWRWGAPHAPQLFLLHGWMDAGASFQFLAEELGDAWQLIAPDWRGFGRSQWAGGPYWFPDYLADLDALLSHYSPDVPAALVGASMGGNVACLYAGVRPQRVSRVATLEGFGLAPADPAQAPQRLAHWLDQLGEGLHQHPYADFGQLAHRLRRDNPRLGAERAEFLAHHLGRRAQDGTVELAADPHHRLSNPILYRIEEVMACWRCITVPVLWVSGGESTLVRRFFAHDEDYRARLACFACLREAVIEEAGHNLHWDQPQRLARLLQDFLRDEG